MYNIIHGNVLSQNADAYVITVNCVGAMGKGIARSARYAIPGLYDNYKLACRNKKITPGSVGEYTYQGKRYLLAATKNHFKDQSQVQWLEMICRKIANCAIERGISRIAMPPIGCSNGWLVLERDLIPLLDKYFSNHEVVVDVCL